MSSGASLGHRQAVLAIGGAWAGWLCLLALLGALGFGTGLAIWPMGEDRNWIALLRLPTAGETARGFWAIDHRNPLSPWWYIAFKPAILGWPYGLFALRNLVGLALALSTYALATTWLGPKARRLAAAIACLIAIHTSNAFFDQIYWNFQAALACSLLCVTCWLRHRATPGEGGWLAASLVLWLLAIGTYTIQTGAIVAIGLAAFLSPLADGRRNLPAQVLLRLRAAISAAWPFGFVLLLFLLIWQTTSVPSERFVGAPTLSRMVETLSMGFVHADTVLMAQVLARSPHRVAYLAVGALVFVVALYPSRFVAPRLTRGALLRLLALVACLAVPTLAIETFGTQWPPGSRWRMIYQVTTPVFSLGLLALLASFLPRRPETIVWRLGFCACLAMAAIASLAHNERQVLLTQNEQALRATIRDDAARQAQSGRPAPHYLVFLDERTRWFASDTLSRVYAQTWFPGGAASYRLVPSPIYEGLQPGPPVTFLDDGAGIANATSDGLTLPYAQVRFVIAQGGRFSVTDRLAEADLAGFRALWRRDGSIGPRP